MSRPKRSPRRLLSFSRMRIEVSPTARELHHISIACATVTTAPEIVSPETKPLNPHAGPKTAPTQNQPATMESPEHPAESEVPWQPKPNSKLTEKTRKKAQAQRHPRAAKPSVSTA